MTQNIRTTTGTTQHNTTSSSFFRPHFSMSLSLSHFCFHLASFLWYHLKPHSIDSSSRLAPRLTAFLSFSFSSLFPLLVSVLLVFFVTYFPPFSASSYSPSLSFFFLLHFLRITITAKDEVICSQIGPVHAWEKVT